MTAPHPRVLQVSAEDIVDRRELFARIDRVGKLPAAERGAVAFQLRDPQLAGCALHRLAVELRERTQAVGARLVINDRVDLACLVAADGLHLGRKSMGVADARRLFGKRWISVSAHGLADLDPAVEQGADAVVLSPIFPTPGKGAPLGVELLRRARARLPASMGLIALGGISHAQVASCRAAGADGVASIRADLVSTAGDTVAT